MRSAIIFISVLLTTLTLSATHVTASDEVYRWVDENGVVHFGERADSPTDAEKIQIYKQPDEGADTNPVPAQAEPQPSLAQQRREERAEKRKEAAEKNRAQAEECERARQRILRLEPSPRVMVQNADGSVERLDDDKRLELLADAKAYITDYCEK